METRQVTEGKVMLRTHFAFSEDDCFESVFFLFSLASLQNKAKTESENSCLMHIRKNEKCPYKTTFSLQTRVAGLCVSGVTFSLQ